MHNIYYFRGTLGTTQSKHIKFSKTQTVIFVRWLYSMDIRHEYTCQILRKRWIIVYDLVKLDDEVLC